MGKREVCVPRRGTMQTAWSFALTDDHPILCPQSVVPQEKSEERKFASERETLRAFGKKGDSPLKTGGQSPFFPNALTRFHGGYLAGGSRPLHSSPHRRLACLICNR